MSSQAEPAATTDLHYLRATEGQHEDTEAGASEVLPAVEQTIKSLIFNIKYLKPGEKILENEIQRFETEIESYGPNVSRTGMRPSRNSSCSSQGSIPTWRKP